MNEARLALRGVVVRRGSRPVLRVESLDIHGGEVLAVIGPNGAGKSTLVQTLALLERPAEGEVLYGGLPVPRNTLPLRRRMAVVFQEPLLLDTTVESNVGSGLAIRGVPAAERRRRVALWLERFGIGHLASRSARTLSGGEAQRVSLARALVLEPEVLFLDEPFAALDAPTRQTLMDELAALLAGSDLATVFVTHDRDEALRLADRVAVLIGGEILQIGEPADVFAAPGDERVASFVGVETIIAGIVRELRDSVAIVDVGGRQIEGGAGAAVGEDVLVCLRPEDVILNPAHEGGIGTSARNHIPAEIRRMVPAGAYVRVELDAGFRLVALVTKHAVEELGLGPGVHVAATFKATAVHLIRRV
jgi:tungstate transport system ATP-binding protein